MTGEHWKWVIVGKWVHSLALGRVQMVEMGAIVVDQHGRIAAMDVGSEFSDQSDFNLKALDESGYKERLVAYVARLRSLWPTHSSTRVRFPPHN